MWFIRREDSERYSAPAASSRKTTRRHNVRFTIGEDTVSAILDAARLVKH
ncbi:MAG: hypothetical protein ACR2FU_17645 [Streptosporangiaceae bacterium]